MQKVFSMLAEVHVSLHQETRRSRDNEAEVSERCYPRLPMCSLTEGESMEACSEAVPIVTVDRDSINLINRLLLRTLQLKTRPAP